MIRSVLIVVAIASTARAGTVSGKLELPPAPERPPPAPRGFLERVENPLKPPMPQAITPYLVVVLEGKDEAAPPECKWDLAGESFLHPIVACMAGAEVTIKNTSKTSRTIVAAEDSKLIPAGPINPTPGTKSFKVSEAGKTYTIRDPDASYFFGRIVVVASPHIGYPEDTATANVARFDITDVPEGLYKLRVFYKDAWLDIEQPVTVGKSGKVEVTTKIAVLPAGPKK
jgi:hypothetical protein